MNYKNTNQRYRVKEQGPFQKSFSENLVETECWVYTSLRSSLIGQFPWRHQELRPIRAP